MLGYKNFAFISYSHRDMAMAKWLQTNLEKFKLPTEIHNTINLNSRYLRPVFRDQSDLNAGILSHELKKHLEESKYLIIICSKNSAQSPWVSEETKAFVEMGRLDRIIPVIISDDEKIGYDIFPLFLRQYFEQNPDKELLGINVSSLGKNKALICVVSKMLNVSFDSLWKRHQRQQRLRVFVYSTASLITLGLTYIFAMPVTVNFSINPERSHLPVHEEISLMVDGAEYVYYMTDSESDDIRMPGYKRFSEISVIAQAQYFKKVDTLIPVGLGWRRKVSLNLCRDNTFSCFKGHVYDEDMNPIPNVEVLVGGKSGVTDLSGEFEIILPIDLQREYQNVIIRKDGFKTVNREDESPDVNLKYIMHR